MITQKLTVKAALVGAGAVAIAGLGLGNRAIAQDALTFIFETATLTPGFEQDSVTLHGISGGFTTADQLTAQAETPTGACLGYVDTDPDHILVLEEFFDYLKLQVQSPEDTTMVVKGPGGTWCNDDFTDQNPAIAGQWLPGTYQVWIGSYRKDKYSPYIIQVSETR